MANKRKRVSLTTTIINGEEVVAKECTKCDIVLPLDDFNYKSNGLGKKNSSCKACLKNYRDSRREEKSEYDRKYRQVNIDKVKENQSRWHEENRESQNRKRSYRYYKHRDEELRNMKEYRTLNRDKLNAKQREYYRENIDKFREYYENNAGRIKLYRAQYYIENKEEFRDRWQTYYNENRTSLLISGRDYYYRNRRQVLHRWRQYYRTDKGQLASKRASHRRRDRERNTLFMYEPKDWEHALAMFGHQCAYCGSDVNLTRDHFVPVSKGGDFTPYNIIPACASCNSSKRDSDFSTWYKNKSFYSELREYYIKGYVRHKKNIFSRHSA